MEGTSIIMTPPFPWTFLIFGHRPWPMPAPIEKKNSVQSGTISRIREADGTKPNYRIPVPLWKFTWKPVKEKKIYPLNLDPIHSSLIKSFFPEILILICVLADRVFGRFDADTRREMEQKKEKMATIVPAIPVSIGRLGHRFPSYLSVVRIVICGGLVRPS